MKTLIAGCSAVLVGCASHAPIPEDSSKPMTLREVLDSGGAQMSKEMLVAELPGTSMYTSPNPGEISFRTDGTFTGFVGVSGSRTTGVGIHGTWSVADDGKVCIQHGSVSARTSQQCRYVFKLGSDYFLTTSPNDRDAPAPRQRLIAR